MVNEDQTSHNIHPLAKVNREWNKSQPPGTPPFREVRQGGIHSGEVQCSSLDARLLRRAEDIALRDHRDNGSFTLPNLPPGKYTITAWQEDYGTQTQDVTISGSETKTVDFTFKAKPY